MMNKLLKALMLTLALMLVSAPAWAQVGRLSGNVIDENGNPVQGAILKIDRTDQRGSYEVKTRKKGNYMHAGLPMGTYTVALVIDGEVYETVQGVRVSPTTDRTLDFDLEATKKKQESLREQVESGTASEEQFRGMSDKQRKELEAAMKKRQQQMSKNKALNDAFNGGMAALKAKDYSTAIESLSTAAEISPEQAVIWGNLGEAQAQMALTITGEEQTALLAQATESYGKAMELNPTQGAYPNNLGVALMQTGRMDEGIALLEKAAVASPENAGRYFFNAGAIMTNAGDIDGAAAMFQRATDLQPDFAPAHFQLATALMGKATFTPEGVMVPAEGTAEAFEKYLELDPTSPYAETAKAMLASLTAKVDTSFKQ